MRASKTVRIESGCGQNLEVRHQDIHADRTKKGDTDLDGGMEGLPVVCKEKVGLVWHADGQTELPPEYTRGRLTRQNWPIHVCVFIINANFSAESDGITDAPWNIDYTHHSGLTETPCVLLLEVQAVQHRGSKVRGIGD